MNDKLKKKIPNAITISRMIISSMGAVFFLKEAYIVAVICYLYGAISDFLDGHFAKKFDAYSDLGRKLDGFSDKIYSLALAIPAIINGNILMILPLILEAKIGFHNLDIEKKGNKVFTKRIGKFKTVLLFITMILGLIASKCIFFVIPFVPALAYTLNLQKKTYEEYKKDEEKIANNEIIEDNSRGVEHEDMPLIEKLRVLKDELIFYSGNYEDKEFRPKIKKRNDKYDRY